MCTEASEVRAVRLLPCSDGLVEKPGVDLAASNQIIDSYVAYLTVERGLTVGTVGLYASVVSRCLDEWTRLGVDVGALDAADVIGFRCGRVEAVECLIDEERGDRPSVVAAFHVRQGADLTAAR